MITWLVIRLVLGVLLFAIALHVLMLNATVPGWYATVVATEYGHLLVPFAWLAAAAGIGSGAWHAVTGTVLLLAAGLIMLVPLALGARLGRRLPRELAASFGEPAHAPRPGPPRGRIKPERLEYSTGADGPRSLLFFRPAGSSAAPCIIVLHGGGWERGGPHDLAHWNSHWASRGYAVAAMSYRLAPRHRWPAQRDDVGQALNFLKQNAARLAIDAERFVIIGRSAGGQIAMASAYAFRDPAIRGLVSIYAPADMFFAREHARSDDLLDSLGLVRRLLGGDPHEAEENYRSASGILLADEQSCPTLLLHGAHDAVVGVEQSRRLARRLEGLGVRHFYIEMPWATHGFDFPGSGPGARIMRRAVDFFLDARLRA